MKKIIFSLVLLLPLITLADSNNLRVSGEAAHLGKVNVSSSGVPANAVARMKIYLRSVGGDTCIAKTGALTMRLMSVGAVNSSTQVTTAQADYLLDSDLDNATCNGTTGYLLKDKELVSGLAVARFSTATLADGTYYADLSNINASAGTVNYLGGLRTNTLRFATTTTTPPPSTALGYKFVTAVPLQLATSTLINLTWTDPHPTATYTLSLLDADYRYYINRNVPSYGATSTTYQWQAGETLPPAPVIKANKKFFLKVCRVGAASTCVNSNLFSFASSTSVATNGNMVVTATWNDNSTHPISLAIDGNPDTYYQACSSKDNRYNTGSVIVDLGSVVQSGGFRVVFGHTDIGAGPTKYSVDVSQTKGAWKRVYNYPASIEEMSLSHTFYTPTNMRYLRINYEKIGGGKGQCLALKDIQFVAPSLNFQPGHQCVAVKRVTSGAGVPVVESTDPLAVPVCDSTVSTAVQVTVQTAAQAINALPVRFITQ